MVGPMSAAQSAADSWLWTSIIIGAILVTIFVLTPLMERRRRK